MVAVRREPLGGVREQLAARLQESGALGSYLATAPAAGEAGYLRLDCTVVVDPGSRAARYAVGFGAGKSRSIFEIHLLDHASSKELGLYHGYGVGSGMGVKLVGGGARKMTQDDIQENTKLFVDLVGEVLRAAAPQPSSGASGGAASGS